MTSVVKVQIWTVLSEKDGVDNDFCNTGEKPNLKKGGFNKNIGYFCILFWTVESYKKKQLNFFCFIIPSFFLIYQFFFFFLQFN